MLLGQLKQPLVFLHTQAYMYKSNFPAQKLLKEHDLYPNNLFLSYILSNKIQLFKIK